MKDFVLFLVTPLVADTSQLQVTVSGSVVAVQVAKEDMGKVIGKHGSTISALRNLVRAYCTLQNLPPVSLNLKEEN